MRYVNHLLLLILFLLFSMYQLSTIVSSLATTPNATHHQCLDRQGSALAQLQENLLVYSDTTSSYSKAMLWDLKTDCCSWNGVACDDAGHVTQLHLNYIDNLQLQKPVLGTVFKNLSFLVELNLDHVNISAQGTNWCELISHAFPNLRVLSLSHSGLSGPICSSLFEMRFLSELYLNDNPLSSIQPIFLGNISNLVTVHLSFCELAESFPKEILLLPKLEYIDLSANWFLSSQLPEFPLNSSIHYLSLSGTNFYGKLPWSISNLKYLTVLDLGSCKFSGVIPSSLANLTQLEELILSSNSFSGSIPSFHRGGFPNLSHLYLSDNQLNGILYTSLFTDLPSLWWLDLSSNRFISELNEFPNASSSMLETLDLGYNNFRGPIPRSIFELPKIIQLSIGHNNFSAPLNLSYIQNQTNLNYLDLSYVSIKSDNRSLAFLPLQFLSLSTCNFTEFPDFLKAQNNLKFLDLSNNHIHGSVPSWIWNLNLAYLNLSNNYLEFLNLFSPFYLQTLDFHANRLHGPLPKVLCNFSELSLLDLSYNHLGGQIPDCFVHNGFLSVLNLQGNNFNSIAKFLGPSSLQSLNINGNKVEGRLPRSLANCSRLEVLDVGDNMISDTFPAWLGKLPALMILVLRANKFYGQIGHLDVLNSFSVLHVMDLSSNEFTGYLSKDFVQSFRAMQVTSNAERRRLSYVGDGYGANFFHYRSYYKESMTIMYKGLESHMERIMIMFTCLDLSQNNFYGEIPEEIRYLKSLIVLNLSHNSFIGHIPSSMESLAALESLDLSKNHLSGKIPTQLTGLTFLAVMNLSYNQLEGSIPNGQQFNTFSNTSYEGNPRLCGPPLTKKCTAEEPMSPPVVNDEDSWAEYILDWKIVGMGYGSGLVIGFSIGYTIFTQMRIKWFTNLERRAREYGNRRFTQGQTRRLRAGGWS